MNFCSQCGLESSGCLCGQPFPNTPAGRDLKIQQYLESAVRGVRRIKPQDPDLQNSFLSLMWLSAQIKEIFDMS